MGVVSRLFAWRQSTALMGVVDCLPRGGQLPPGSSRSTAPLGTVDCLLGSSRLTALFGVVDGNFLADRHTCGNVKIERSLAGNMVELEIPKACSLYSSQNKLNRMLGKFFLYDDYVYRAPLPSEQLSGSDLREIFVYKDRIDGGLSPFEMTPLVESQVKILECLDPPASKLSDVLTKDNILSVGLFKPTGMKFNLAGVLGSVPLATDDEGPSSPEQAKRRKTATKAKRVACDKNALVSAGGATEDDHIDLTRGADLMHADDDHTMMITPLEILLFPTCIFCSIMLGEIWKSCGAALYLTHVLTLEDSLVKACKRTVTNLEVVENEKSKEIHHLKKKNSNLRKSCEASEARVKEQERGD
ncbi:hypothetical protein Adt_35042 [Abeliophyllum distichum]|uniref:Uncharacterized protein n=1 Tax=Abeliophyllum distichum TaxID=126358 RepID=A0ABD1QDL1_9LAMI